MIPQPQQETEFEVQIGHVLAACLPDLSIGQHQNLVERIEEIADNYYYSRLRPAPSAPERDRIFALLSDPETRKEIVERLSQPWSIDTLREIERIRNKHNATIRNQMLDTIEESLTTCAFYDEMISSEDGCPGQRNGEHTCDGCSYFEIDGNQLKATIESLSREVLE